MTTLGFVLMAAAGTTIRAVSAGLDTSFNHKVLATLTVNVLGSFLLGLLASSSADTMLVGGVAGMGAMTTFSSFVLQVECIAREGTVARAAAYALASVAAGIGAAWIGWSLA